MQPTRANPNRSATLDSPANPPQRHRKPKRHQTDPGREHQADIPQIQAVDTHNPRRSTSQASDGDEEIWHDAEAHAKHESDQEREARTSSHPLPKLPTEAGNTEDIHVTRHNTEPVIHHAELQIKPPPKPLPKHPTQSTESYPHRDTVKLTNTSNDRPGTEPIVSHHTRTTSQPDPVESAEFDPYRNFGSTTRRHQSQPQPQSQRTPRQHTTSSNQAHRRATVTPYEEESPEEVARRVETRAQRRPHSRSKTTPQPRPEALPDQTTRVPSHEEHGHAEIVHQPPPQSQATLHVRSASSDQKPNILPQTEDSRETVKHDIDSSAQQEPQAASHTYSTRPRQKSRSTSHDVGDGRDTEATIQQVRSKRGPRPLTTRPTAVSTNQIASSTPQELQEAEHGTEPITQHYSQSQSQAAAQPHHTQLNRVITTTSQTGEDLKDDKQANDATTQPQLQAAPQPRPSQSSQRPTIMSQDNDGHDKSKIEIPKTTQQQFQAQVPVSQPHPIQPLRRASEKPTTPSEAPSGRPNQVSHEATIAHQTQQPLQPQRPPPQTTASQMDTQYVNMLLALDSIPRLHNMLASFFTWILLAGFVLFPGTFTSLQNTPPGALNGTEERLVTSVRHVSLFVIAFICCGIGSGGMCWLWWRWRKNYIWLVNRIFLPGFMNSVAGIVSTLASVYGAQGGGYSTTSKTTIIVTGVIAGICGSLTGIYSFWLLRNVKKRHDQEVGKERAGKYGEGFVDLTKRKVRETEPEAGMI